MPYVWLLNGLTMPYVWSSSKTEASLVVVLRSK